ncbi:serine/threonine protein kinase, putative [Plasmodium malariae]|uniref:Serine/threonine protein kinase, putative n=1 Tax=Plasmodium malariae TaxID=5858 RepID=A0A1A8W246_PLAMA|nr:serine/threonine protein kinase, putative [Plasmodium malariae]SBS86024.1 serine/threonine protein kinase, putative [Plasmodium malariae]SCN12993.1 serine/threonine protein kinase, putative [Plasmodium malariae]
MKDDKEDILSKNFLKQRIKHVKNLLIRENEMPKIDQVFKYELKTNITGINDLLHYINGIIYKNIDTFQKLILLYSYDDNNDYDNSNIKQNTFVFLLKQKTKFREKYKNENYIDYLKTNPIIFIDTLNKLLIIPGISFEFKTYNFDEKINKFFVEKPDIKINSLYNPCFIRLKSKNFKNVIKISKKVEKNQKKNDKKKDKRIEHHIEHYFVKRNFTSITKKSKADFISKQDSNYKNELNIKTEEVNSDEIKCKTEYDDINNNYKEKYNYEINEKSKLNDDNDNIDRNDNYNNDKNDNDNNGSNDDNNNNNKDIKHEYKKERRKRRNHYMCTISEGFSNTNYNKKPKKSSSNNLKKKCNKYAHTKVLKDEEEYESSVNYDSTTHSKSVHLFYNLIREYDVYINNVKCYIVFDLKSYYKNLDIMKKLKKNLEELKKPNNVFKELIDKKSFKSSRDKIEFIKRFKKMIIPSFRIEKIRKQRNHLIIVELMSKIQNSLIIKRLYQELTDKVNLNDLINDILHMFSKSVENMKDENVKKFYIEMMNTHFRNKNLSVIDFKNLVQLFKKKEEHRKNQEFLNLFLKDLNYLEKNKKQCDEIDEKIHSLKYLILESILKEKQLERSVNRLLLNHEQSKYGYFYKIEQSDDNTLDTTEYGKLLENFSKEPINFYSILNKRNLDKHAYHDIRNFNYKKKNCETLKADITSSSHDQVNDVKSSCDNSKPKYQGNEENQTSDNSIKKENISSIVNQENNNDSNDNDNNGSNDNYNNNKNDNDNNDRNDNYNIDKNDNDNNDRNDNYNNDKNDNDRNDNYNNDKNDNDNNGSNDNYNNNKNDNDNNDRNDNYNNDKNDNDSNDNDNNGSNDNYNNDSNDNDNNDKNDNDNNDRNDNYNNDKNDNDNNGSNNNDNNDKNDNDNNGSNNNDKNDNDNNDRNNNNNNNDDDDDDNNNNNSSTSYNINTSLKQLSANKNKESNNGCAEYFQNNIINLKDGEEEPDNYKNKIGSYNKCKIKKIYYNGDDKKQEKKKEDNDDMFEKQEDQNDTKMNYCKIIENDNALNSCTKNNIEKKKESYKEEDSKQKKKDSIKCYINKYTKESTFRKSNGSEGTRQMNCKEKDKFDEEEILSEWECEHERDIIRSICEKKNFSFANEKQEKINNEIFYKVFEQYPYSFFSKSVKNYNIILNENEEESELSWLTMLKKKGHNRSILPPSRDTFRDGTHFSNCRATEHTLKFFLSLLSLLTKGQVDINLKEYLKKNIQFLNTELFSMKLNLDKKRAILEKRLDHFNFQENSEFSFYNPLKMNIRMMNLIGRGGFAEVWEVFDSINLEMYAAKIHKIEPSMTNEIKNKIIQRAENEINIHIHCHRHIFIVKLEFFFVFGSATNLLVGMELCDIDLDKYIKYHGPINEHLALCWIKQVLLGLLYMKNLPTGKVHHCDLKPANLLIKDGIIKISDFGLAKLILPDTYQYYNGGGTLYYQPPECLKNKKNLIITDKIDIWSLGCIFYEMLFCERPFQFNYLEKCSKELLVNKMKRGLSYPKINQHISDVTLSYIQYLLNFDHEFRPSIEEALSYPIFNYFNIP